MISYSDFNRLNRRAAPNEDKSEFTFDEEYCTYLISIWENTTYSLNLYHATNAPGGPYFIEQGRLAVWYDEEISRIESFRSFKTHKALEPYLPHIDISEGWP